MTSDIDRAVASLRRGGIVVLPTDTVYGIGALPDRPVAIEAIFRAKGRSESNPLPVLGASIEDLASVVTFDERATRLAGSHWPGPLTLVLPRAPDFEPELGGLHVGGVAVRVPACEPALALLRRSGPLAVTSANRSGDAPATTAADAGRIFGATIEVVIDGGTCNGAPSTVMSLLGEPEILRAGPIEPCA
ncbi:MAG: L-threonylcarbamoyladenylate synthase [Actinomycetota bacterium]